MSILYRRFFLVAAFISAMGALTANVIQETRSERFTQFNGVERISPLPGCGEQYCATRHTMFAVNAHAIG